MSTERKQILAGARRVIVKIGTGVLTGTEGLDREIIQQLVDEMAELIRKGYHIVIVTSGAIASGKNRMGISGKLKSMPEKQACAAIGQSRVMRVYSNAFGTHGMYVAQILLTMDDLTDRKRFINVKNTLSTLMEWNVIPIINENDTVAVDEIKFGDNDHLAAVVANITEADLVISMTNTDGLYDRNPKAPGVKKAKLIGLVRDITDDIESMATAEADPTGMGGMRSKVLAARKVTACGIPYIIARGKKKGILGEIFCGQGRGDPVYAHDGVPLEPRVLDRLHAALPGKALRRRRGPEGHRGKRKEPPSFGYREGGRGVCRGRPRHCHRT